MANRYWVGGTGNWDATSTTHWASTSGGAAGASVPTSSDDVFFDASSGAGTVTVTASATTKSLNYTGYTGTFAGSQSMYLYGGLTLASGMTYTYTGTISFRATDGGTYSITSNGKTIAGGFYMYQQNANYSLGDNLTTTGPVNIGGQGTFSTNNHSMTTGTLTFSFNDAGVAITLGSSSISCSSITTVFQSPSSSINFGTSTVTAGSSRLVNVSPYNLVFDGSLSSSHVPDYKIGGTVTVTNSFTSTGTAQDKILIRGIGSVWSSGQGISDTVQATLSVASLSSMTYTVFWKIDVTGAASPLSGTYIGDGGSNSGVTFSSARTLYWVGNGGNWHDTAHWSLTTGGASGAPVPLPQDTVIFDANSISSGTQNIYISTFILGGDINMSAVTNSPKLYYLAASLTQTLIFGDLTLGSGMTTYGVAYYYSASVYFINDATLTTNGVSLDFNLATVGTLTLGSDLTITRQYVTMPLLVYGGFDTANYNVNIKGFAAYSGSTVSLGSSTVTLTDPLTYVASYINYWYVDTAATLNAGTSTIIIQFTTTGQKTVSFGGKTYYNVTITGDNIWFDTAATFYNLTLNNAGSANGTVLKSGKTFTVTNTFSTNGSSGSLVKISSSTSGSAHTLNKTSGVVSEDYMNLSDSSAVGGATWYAGANSTNSGGNSGWIFSAAPVPVDNTKSAQYTVKSAKSKTKTAQYGILLNHDLTKSAQYIVSNDSSVLKSASYSVTSQQETTKSAQYLVVERSDITKSAGYRVSGYEYLDSSTLKALKIGSTFGPITSVVLGRTPQNDNIIISNQTSTSNDITSIDTTTDLFTIVGHGMSDGTLVRISSDGTYPSPLLPGTNYYVYTAGNADTFSLTNTYENAVNGVEIIDITTSGSGSITLDHIETQEIQINNNEILDDDRQDLLPPIYQALVGLEWSEVDATTVGLGWHEVGDVVRFTQGDTTVNGLLSEIHLVFDGGIKEKLKSVIPDGSVVDHQTAGGVIKTVYNTEIKVDKQNNDIESIVSEQSSFADTVNTSFTEIYQTLTDIDLTIQKAGGGNIILNSVGFATESTTDFSSVQYDKLSFWDYNTDYDTATNGTVTSYSSSESQNNGGVSGQVIEMVGTDVSITQRVNIAANTDLCFGLRVKNEIGTGSALITLSNDNDTYTIYVDNATDYDWDVLSLESFTSSLPWLDITIQVSSTLKFVFTDLRLLYGTTLQGWVQSSSEILSTNVQFTKDGMKIFDNIHDTETRVTYNEFSTRRKTDDAVLFEADDSGVVTNDLKIRGITEYQSSGDPVIRQVTIPNSSALAGIAFIKVV